MSDEELTIAEFIESASLMGLAEKKILQEVNRRIKRGDNIDQQKEGDSTAIMTAAWRGYATVVKLLIEAGANLALKNKWKEDVVSCAKISGNKDLIKLIKEAAKGSLSPAKILYFSPKKGSEAEYTFYPTKKFKKDHESDEGDVGFFLRDDEVLALEAIKPIIEKNELVIITVQEGQVTIKKSQWVKLEEKEFKSIMKRNPDAEHAMEKIVQEYLSD